MTRMRRQAAANLSDDETMDYASIESWGLTVLQPCLFPFGKINWWVNSLHIHFGLQVSRVVRTTGHTQAAADTSSALNPV